MNELPFELIAFTRYDQTDLNHETEFRRSFKYNTDVVIVGKNSQQ